MSDSSCESIICTPGWKRNVILAHTVITPFLAPRQLILFVLPIKFCTQMEQNRDPVELAELLFCSCSISFFLLLFSGVCLHQGDSLSLHTSMMAHTNTHIHTRNSVTSSYSISQSEMCHFMAQFFFSSKIKIPGKGFKSDQWPCVEGRWPPAAECEAATEA